MWMVILIVGTDHREYFIFNVFLTHKLTLQMHSIMYIGIYHLQKKNAQKMK